MGLNVGSIRVEVLDVGVVIDQLAEIQVVWLLHCHLELVGRGRLVRKRQLVVQTQVGVDRLVFGKLDVPLLDA